ncbi:multidrug ABC transporter permease [Acinetobacter sp. NCu2D-2]|uniref:ABC transporter permease n=1 Tax=Acinetobacter sp. NCu2D-2 TaxID=1608473 RepID=UPI0007CDAB3F|nr:ABC transporter permease [Acinetobacter sp. NCu2D-2]ANF82196.1 multidrug ABC transporter permease [Acinetobacter sp. NCu2D-2]
MKTVWLAYVKTFKDIVSNTSIFTTLILSVIFYSFFYPTAYEAQQAEALPIIIVDEEQSALTATIIQHVSQSPNVDIKTVTGNFSEAKALIESQQADGILLLPSNLSQSIRHGENGGIGLYLSAANFLVTKQIGLGLVASIENTLSNYAERFSQISTFSPAISIHQIPLFNTLSGYGSYVFPAVAPLIIHQTILLGLSMLLALYMEQQHRITFQRLVGICLAIFTIGCLGCFYLFGFTFWWYDYPRGGNFIGMLMAVPISMFCIIGLTTLLASFLDLPERAGHVIVFTSIPLFMLSGVAWPHAAMPIWMQSFANVLPSTQIIQMFIQLNQMGVPTSIVLPKLVYLFSFGALCMAIGYWRLTKKSKAQVVL